HTVVVSKGGCSKQFTFDVGQPGAMSTSVVSTGSINCFGACTGSVQFAAGGGVGSYSFATASATNTSGAFTGLCSGPVTATITDANGCSTSVNTNILQPASAVGITAIITSSSCASCSGQATVTASGGTTPYSYSYASTLGVVPAM